MQLTGFLRILKPFIDMKSHTHTRQIFLSANISNLAYKGSIGHVTSSCKWPIKPLKETDPGVAQAFFWPPKRNHVKTHDDYIYFYIFSRATLNKTFTPKYDGVFPKHPKCDKNPKFTPLSETTSIPTPFTPREPSCLYSVWKTNWNLESIKVIIKKCFTSVHQVHLCIDWDACTLQLFLFFRHKEKWDSFARGSNPRGDTRDFKWRQEPITGWKGWSKDFFGVGKSCWF